jgi:hypothetical protein
VLAAGYSAGGPAARRIPEAAPPVMRGAVLILSYFKEQRQADYQKNHRDNMKPPCDLRFDIEFTAAVLGVFSHFKLEMMVDGGAQKNALMPEFEP